MRRLAPVKSINDMTYKREGKGVLISSHYVNTPRGAYGQLFEFITNTQRRLRTAIAFAAELMADIAPQTQLRVQPAGNADFQFADIICARLADGFAIHTCGELPGIVDPTGFDKRL